MATSLTLDEEQVAALREVLNSTDALCTSVVSGRTQGQMQLALGVARALDALKRKKVVLR
jgi:hypothetical protein